MFSSHVFPSQTAKGDMVSEIILHFIDSNQKKELFTFYEISFIEKQGIGANSTAQ